MGGGINSDLREAMSPGWGSLRLKLGGGVYSSKRFTGTDQSLAASLLDPDWASSLACLQWRRGKTKRIWLRLEKKTKMKCRFPRELNIMSHFTGIQLKCVTLENKKLTVNSNTNHVPSCPKQQKHPITDFHWEYWCKIVLIAVRKLECGENKNVLLKYTGLRLYEAPQSGSIDTILKSKQVNLWRDDKNTFH